MEKARDAAVLVGSLRKESLTRKVAEIRDLQLLFATPEYNRSVPGCIKNAAYISQAGELMDAEHNFTKDASETFFASFLKAFAEWIDLIVQ